MWKHRPPSRSDSKSGNIDSSEHGFFGRVKKKSPLRKYSVYLSLTQTSVFTTFFTTSLVLLL
ncbi:hypothetical protein P175DRAFT_0501494 [Aspergillus ochraceoroseus IBT 24754]|uniref:Uncharacterized protein n=1 Tax=Aspergillus ochraceoroseus IBT 24754 TaxID=1392256 RepID=A0A2T5LX60_9EURO|nr:uncharacterized protein P175DRAFT_0501494 [Aspergillus ochraceoroseus IBT 24754]PTU20857.1 hypothetical protein P175DRAFT_0501494 [Aspergillus ochraceoroseus IBT 24754]